MSEDIVRVLIVRVLTFYALLHGDVTVTFLAICP